MAVPRLQWQTRPRAVEVARDRGGPWRRHLAALRVLGRAAWHLLPVWPWLLGLLVATLAGISAELVEPWLHKNFVNRVLLGHDLRLLPTLLVLYGAAALAQWLSGTAVHYCFVQSTERFSITLRLSAYVHLRGLGLRRLRHLSSGEVTAALQQFGPEVGEGLIALGQSLLASLYRLPASLLLLSRLNGPLLHWTLPALALYPLYPAVTSGPLRRALARLALYDVHTQGVVTDRVAALRAMLPSVDPRPEATMMGALLWRRLGLRVRAFLVERAGGLVDMLAHQGMTVLLLGLGGMSVLHGHMEVGGLLAFMEYVRGVEGPVRRLVHLPVNAQRVAVVAERVFTYMDLEPELTAPARGRPAHLRGAVEFRDVVVRGDDGRFLLDGVNLRIPAGAHCVILGQSGAGKSTMGALIPRFMDPDAGQVLLDGADAREYDLGGLRRAVALVPQDPVFVRESVLDNVRLAAPWATAAAAERAVRRAHAEDLLEGGAGRILDEAGGNLSGGQRQRLALARAYLQEPAVLVLDEATSALDPPLQHAVMSDLAQLHGRCTVVMITHQEEWARRADLVVRVEDGRITYAGPPGGAGIGLGVPRRGQPGQPGAVRGRPLTVGPRS